MTLDRKKLFKAAFFINRRNSYYNKADQKQKDIMLYIQDNEQQICGFTTKKDYADIYLNNDNKTRKTFLAQPIAEGLGIALNILSSRANKFSSIFTANDSRSIFNSKIYIPEIYKKIIFLQNDKIKYYKTEINFETDEIYVAAFDSNNELIPIQTELGPVRITSNLDRDTFHYHDMDMMLPIFATYYLIVNEVDTNYKNKIKECINYFNDVCSKQISKKSKEDFQTQFIALCEDLYQEHKNDSYTVVYADNSPNIEVQENIINGKIQNSFEEIDLTTYMDEPEQNEFNPSDFKAEQLDYIPKLPPEMILSQDLEGITNAIYKGDCIATLFHGPAGTGKTANCKLICQKIKLPIMEVINCTESSDESVLGKYIPQEEKIIFKESKIVEAIRYGGAVVFEEINFSKPQHTAFLNSLLDDNGFVILDNGEKVKRNKNFRFFATMNYGYAGTRPLNEATYNRFNCVYKVDELPVEAIKNMLKTRVPECTKMIPQMIQIYEKIKNLIKIMESDSGHISPRNLENWARMAKYTSWKKAAECTILPCANFDEELEEEIKKVLKGI